jgi:alcohol oxidase
VSWPTKANICRYIYFPIFSPADLQVVTLRWAYKHIREIGRRMRFCRGDLQVGHPAFAEGSQAAAQLAGPVEISSPKIVYSKEDDDAIDGFHRRSGSYTT